MTRRSRVTPVPPPGPVGPASAHNIVRALAHSPAALDGVSGLARALATGGVVPPRRRELVVLRVAAVRRCAYVWGRHLTAARAAGVDDAALAALWDGTIAPSLAGERAVLRLAEAVEDGAVGDALWAEVVAASSEAEAVELCALAACYGMVCRLASAFDLAVDDDVSDVGPPSSS